MTLVAGMTGCTSGGHTSAPTTAAGPTTAAAPTTSATTAGSSTPGSNTAGSTPTTFSAATATEAHNLAVDDAVRSSLLTAFATFKDGPVSHYSGPVAGSASYAYLQSDGKYWALAHFSITPAATEQEQVAMQDGGDIGISATPFPATRRSLQAPGGPP